MPDRTGYAPGTPSWIDLQTSDQAGAKAFYSALFGWEYDDQPVGQDEAGNEAFYSMATKNGKHVAAIAPLPMPGVPPHWNVYVTVADVDATAAQVPAAGGTVMMPPFDVMDAGRMCGGRRPDRRDVVHLAGEEPHRCESRERARHVVVGRADDARRSRGDRVLLEALRLGGRAVDIPGMEYTELKLGDRGIGGAMKPPMEGMPPVWGVYFAVDDADKTAEIAKANGGTVMQEPMDIPPGRMARDRRPGRRDVQRDQADPAGRLTGLQRQEHETRGPASLRLRHRVLPAHLARAAHHEQITGGRARGCGTSRRPSGRTRNGRHAPSVTIAMRVSASSRSSRSACQATLSLPSR